MNIFKKIALINKITKAAKQAKKIIDEHEHLTGDLQKALLNLKADLELLAGLLPSLRNVYKDIKELIDV